MKTAYLSLGSNQGDRKANLEEALRRIESPRLRVLRVSSIWETEPVGVSPGIRSQPWFLNLVVEIETSLFPMMLLAHTGKVERMMGRRRRVAEEQRNIDIDILLFGPFRIDSPRLVVPHPRMHQRRFVLAPLAELAPGLRHPVNRKTMRELLAAVEGQAVRKVSGYHQNL